MKYLALLSSCNYNANVPQHLSNEEMKGKALTIQKVDENNLVVLVENDVYIKYIENFLDDATKFEKVKIKKEVFDFFNKP